MSWSVVTCPLWVINRHSATTIRMSAFGGKADIGGDELRFFQIEEGHSHAMAGGGFVVTRLGGSSLKIGGAYFFGAAH